MATVIPFPGSPPLDPADRPPLPDELRAAAELLRDFDFPRAAVLLETAAACVDYEPKGEPA